jgi:hypothetical protein
MEKKLSKLEQVKRGLSKKGLQQSLLRYIFSKEHSIVAKNLESKLKEFMFKEADRVPNSAFVKIQTKTQTENEYESSSLSEALQE